MFDGKLEMISMLPEADSGLLLFFYSLQWALQQLRDCNANGGFIMDAVLFPPDLGSQ